MVSPLVYADSKSWLLLLSALPVHWPVFGESKIPMKTQCCYLFIFTQDYGHAKQKESSQLCKMRCAPLDRCNFCLEGLHKSAESQQNEAELPASQQISYSCLKTAGWVECSKIFSTNNPLKKTLIIPVFWSHFAVRYFTLILRFSICWYLNNILIIGFKLCCFLLFEKYLVIIFSLQNTCFSKRCF